MSQPLPFLVSASKPRYSGCLENSPSQMKKIPNSNHRLSEHVPRALNKIKKPGTAGEITELLNLDLDQGTALSKKKTSRSGCKIPRTQR